MLRPLAVPASRLVTRQIAQPLSNRAEDEEGRRLYVGNLPWSMSIDDIASNFESSGEVVNAHLPRDQDGRSRGFAFITFASADDASAACEQWEGRDLGGRQVKVRIATPRAAPRSDFD